MAAATDLLIRSRVAELKLLAENTARAWQRGEDVSGPRSPDIPNGTSGETRKDLPRKIIIIHNPRTKHVRRLVLHVLAMVRR